MKRHLMLALVLCPITSVAEYLPPGVDPSTSQMSATLDDGAKANASVAPATQSMYCPQKQGTISLGMTVSQVIGACGEPLSRQPSNNVAVATKIPVTQLIYTTLNQGAVYAGWTTVYNMWSLPSGSTGAVLQINVINNKVTGVGITGGSANVMSICNGASIQVGDDANKVYSSCGNPSMINNTFMKQTVPRSQHPEIWMYQVNEYQSPFSLTFVNGKLQSIN